jgi:hypothetical protein
MNGHQDENGRQLSHRKRFLKNLINTPTEACLLFLTSDFNILMLCLSFNFIGCTNSGVIEA